MKLYYRDERVLIYHGDCRDWPDGSAYDVVITDPPYDAKTHEGMRTTKRDDDGRVQTHQIVAGFDPLDVSQMAPRLVTWATRWVVAFCSLEMLGAYQSACGADYVRSGFWRRVDGAPQFTGDRPGQPGEGIAILHRAGKKRWNGGGKHAFYQDYVVKHDRVHPTQKPETLMAMLVQDFSDPDETVFDPFMGSGTTLVAATRLGRQAVGIELDERYFEIAARRLQQQALPLFSEGGC